MICSMGNKQRERAKVLRRRANLTGHITPAFIGPLSTIISLNHTKYALPTSLTSLISLKLGFDRPCLIGRARAGRARAAILPDYFLVCLGNAVSQQKVPFARAVAAALENLQNAVLKTKQARGGSGVDCDWETRLMWFKTPAHAWHRRADAWQARAD